MNFKKFFELTINEESDKQKEYQKLFKKILAKYKNKDTKKPATEPDQLSNKDKKDFFDEVDLAWTNPKEKKKGKYTD